MATGPEGVPTAALYALMVASAVLGAFGDILLFHWAKGRGGWSLPGGIALWINSLVLMAVLFRRGTLPFGVVVVLLVVLHLLIDLIWDVMMLGTRPTPWQWLGVALAAIAVVLLQLGLRTAPSQ